MPDEGSTVLLDPESPLLDPEKFMALPVQERRDLVEWFIKTFPEKHYQKDWIVNDSLKFEKPNPQLSCGTVGCVAGWATTFAGATPFGGRYGRWDWVTLHDGDPNPPTMLIPELAAAVLGLETEEANYLFEAENTRETLFEMFDDLRHGRSLKETYDSAPEHRTEAEYVDGFDEYGDPYIGEDEPS